MKLHRLQPYSVHIKQRCITHEDKVSRIFSAKNYASFVAAVFVVHLIGINSQSALNSDWPIRVLEGATELTDCEGLGYANATKNNCGYCTGGNTELPQDYGKDCKGRCGGSAVVDCAGICGGAAYTDECSGQCIGGSTSITDNANTYRDCRGYCLASGGQFYNDSCGVCHSGTSPFEDCTNKCHLPGQEYLMAKRVCGRCIGGTSGVSEAEVLDACGNCRSEGKDCICNGTGSPDLCKSCNGGGRSCMRVVSFSPQAAPEKTDFDIFIKGAFRGRVQNLRCLITGILPNESLGRQTEFSGTSNGTHLICRVKMPAALYKVGASIEVGESPEVDHVEETELLIYSSADYSDMTPFKVVFDRESTQELTLTFTGGRVPPRALTCIVSGPGWPSKFKLARSSTNSLDTCIIPYANSSLKLNVSPSLNGIHAFKKSFALTFYASPPEMKKYYIAEDGHAVVIVFDRPVNLCKLESCYDIVNNDTIERLQGNATCKWATKQQLVITVQSAISGDPIRITFKKGVLMQDDQQYALPKNDALTIDAWHPQPTSSAQLAISGPTTVPLCGMFTLVGHFSSPKGDAEFYWTANRADQRRLEQIIANALLGCRTASLTLDITLLEVGKNYTFILTAQHPINEKYEARHVIARKEYLGPIITAYSSAMAQPSVSISQKITLEAEVSIPECVTVMEPVRVLWSVNNPHVKFDFQSRNLLVYKIMPYSLPENSVIVFTAMAYFPPLINVTTSKITLRVEPSMLKAVIKGSSKRVVGNRDGVLVLESSNTNRLPLVYQWRCEDQNWGICYNYDQNATSALLITRDMQKKPKLEIPLTSLKASQKMTFELQVFNANNRYQSSAVAKIFVDVENGSIPQVVIQSVTADGLEPFERHPTTGAYNIPALLPITIHATITVSKRMKMKAVKWDVRGFSTPFTYTTLDENTYLTLDEDFLVDHGIYLIGLSACTSENKCGVANLTIHAVPGVTLCQLVMKSYVEYEQVEAKVTGCSIPISKQPLTYQLYLHQNGSSLAMTPPQTSTTFTFYGPPLPSDNMTALSVEVCDNTNICKLFPGNPVKVSPSEVKTKDRTQLLEKARKLLQNNNAMAALSLFLIAAIDTKTELPRKDTSEMIEAATRAVVNRYVNSGQLGLVYSAMLPLLKKEDKAVKVKALAVMRKATTQAFAYQVKPPTSVLAFGHGNVVEALQSETTDPEVSEKVRQTLDTIVRCIAQSLPLGGRKVLETGNIHQPKTTVYKSILNKNKVQMKAKSTTGNMEGSVVLGDEVLQRFQKWECTNQKNCDGSVVSLTLYPSVAPYPSTNPRVSPVFDISIRNPETGRANPVTFGEASRAIRMALSNNGNFTRAKERGTIFKCYFWNEKERKWSDEGIMTMGTEGNSMLCWASHLSTFAVLEVYEGLSTSSIVGIVVAVLMGVFIFAMLLFFFLRKKQAKNRRVSTEALRPKQPEKLRGVQNSVAHVKRLTD